MSTESSVMTNLRELERLEAERTAEERARAQAEREAEAMAEARARAERQAAEAHAQRVAEAEVRMKRDADAQRRVEALRAELAAVQADRERMHAQIATIADDSWATRPSRENSWGWKAAFASAGAVAAGLALILAIQEPVQTTRIVEVPVERSAVETPAPEVADPNREVVAASAVDETPVTATPTPEARPQRPSPSPRPRPTTMEPDPLADLDCAEDDPTCGI